MVKGVVHACLVVLCPCAGSVVVNSQLNQRKFEVGAMFTSITLDNFKARALPGIATGYSTIKGLGGRFAYNFTDNIALDAEGSFFPETHFGNDVIGQNTKGYIGFMAACLN